MTREQYLLMCLMEECSELQKAASQAIRFGAEDHHPLRPENTNAEEVMIEFFDVMSLAVMLQKEGEAYPRWLNNNDAAKRRVRAKIKKVEESIKYSKLQGTTVDLDLTSGAD